MMEGYDIDFINRKNHVKLRVNTEFILTETNITVSTIHFDT